MNRVDKRAGFTLIELLLAMSFISVLLLAIALTIIQISQTYNRGMTVKEVNQSARSISDELKRSISSSEKFDIASSLMIIKANDNSQVGGRLCIGKYSYIWNTRQATAANDQNIVKVKNTPVRFAKVPDNAGIFCAKNTDGSFQKTTATITSAEAATFTEVLNVGDHDLSLHNFDVSSPAGGIDEVTGQQLYSVSFTIGTSDLNALKKTNGLIYDACKAPNEDGSDLAYCSIQNFTLVIRAGNRVN